MSGGIKYPATQAWELAREVVGSHSEHGLEDLCERIEVCGSLRRGKEMVGDVEIVALPRHAPELLARLDTWVIARAFYKARYSDGSHRWGAKYRGIEMLGYPMKCEIFLADADNWGYIQWLRTGPGDANAYVMSQCQRLNAPYRAVEGDWVEVASGRRLRVPDEAELFRLLGMDYLPPQARTLDAYQRRMRGNWAAAVQYADVEETTTQRGLF